MDDHEKKIFDEVSERIRRSATTKAERDRIDRIHTQVNDMPHLMGAFDAWCASHDINSPIQATLCAYIIGRNLAGITEGRSRKLIANWLLNIIINGLSDD